MGAPFPSSPATVRVSTPAELTPDEAEALGRRLIAAATIARKVMASRLVS